MPLKLILINFAFVFALCCESCSAFNSANETPKTVVITCASGELGSSIARVLAKDYNLVLTGRNISKLQKLQEELKENNPWKYEICTLDYTIKSSIADFKSYLMRSVPSLTGIVLITPRPSFYGKALFLDEEVWLEALQITFTGPLEALKAALPQLTQNSKIVVIAGTTAVQVQPEFGPVCVIRRMWTTYTKALSHQLGPQGIRINAISPGIVLTNFQQEKIRSKSQENGVSYDLQMEQDVAKIPLRRHAQPKELAQAIKFLISDESDFINGINLVFDGGITVSYQ